MIISARAKLFEREHNNRAWAVWHIAALQRAKKLPKLEKLMHRSRKRERQSIKQQIAIAKMWTAAMGGTVKSRKK